MPTLFIRFKNFILKSPLDSAILATFLVAIFYVLVPFGQAADAESQTSEDRAVKLTVEAMLNNSEPYGQLPIAGMREPYSVMTVTASAYNSVPWQTDSTPFITASGTTVRHGVIAANFLPIGTRLMIPDIYGDQIFVVEDRMNKRYTRNIDVWMEEIPEAKSFGRRSVKIYIFPNE